MGNSESSDNTKEEITPVDTEQASCSDDVDGAPDSDVLASDKSSGISSSKDRVLFVSREEALKPVRQDLQALSVLSPDDDDEPHGPVLPDGEINWSCPCMSSMVSGPCGYEFRQAFGCFFKSTAEPKGSDCLDAMEGMHECMVRYPKLYDGHFGVGDDPDDDELAGILSGDDPRQEPSPPSAPPAIKADMSQEAISNKKNK